MTTTQKAWSDREPGAWCCRVLLILSVGGLCALVALPVAADLVRTTDAMRGLVLDAADTRSLGWSMAYAALIGVLATLFGWPLAGLMVRRGPLAGLMLLPVLLPPYLAYAGWGQLRAPGTVLGDWLLTRASAGEHGWPIAAGRFFAVLGLSLWAAPIAGLMMAGGLARRGRGFDEALLLDRAHWAHRGIERLRFHKGELVGGVALVWLVMLGSAIPLHVAQVPTYSIELWLDLAETDPGSWGRVWAGAWPMVLVAITAAWYIAGRAVGPVGSTGGGTGAAACGSRLGSVSGWMIWGLAVLVPVILCAVNITGVTAFVSLWRLDRGALLTSLERGVVVGIVLGLLACSTSVLLSSGSRADRALIRWAAGAALVLGLLPGFLVGASLSRIEIGSPAGPVLAQIARFAFVGVLGGVWACRGESAEQRSVRQLDSGAGLRVWWWSVFPGQWRVLAGVGLAGVALSVHEIEATVFLEPPGSGSLAQKMLGHLHFARMDELNAMSLVIVAIGLIPALGAGMWIGSQRSTTGSATGSATEPSPER